MATQFGFGKIVTNGLAFAVDAADPNSYPRTGTTWRDVTPNNTNGTITGSVAFTSEFYGGLVFSNSSSAVVFPTSSANFGTGSFTVEMTFKPTFINGRHYLMSKNSGSFPNWGIYLSGSNGSGKLWSEFRITSAISCSVSSSTTFVTGSVYQIDVRILPGDSASGIYVNGQTEGGRSGNGGGSLTSTSSLFLGNFALNNTQNFSGSIYSVKTYLQATTEQPVINFNTVSTRFSKSPVPETAKRRYEILVVAGGGGSSQTYGGGGGAGGLQYINTTSITPGTLPIIIGSGGASATNGQNSSFSSFVSIGGGKGGGRSSLNGSSGGSGGGGGGDEGAGTGSFGTGTLLQGNNGASGSSGTGGGGGGAGSAATDKNGGSGSFIASFSTIGGSPAGWFAGGGGGGKNVSGGGDGGIGGGGAGNIGNTAGFTGSANTGGGGGGGTFGAGGAAGGSGIVAIRYSGTPLAIGGEITQSAGYTYHVFRTVGTSSFTIF
jgi:hypothetical protein